MELVGAHLVGISRTRPYSTWSDLWKFISGETTRFHPEILQSPGLGGEDVVAKHTRKRWKFRRSLWRVAGAMGGCSGSRPVDSSSTPSRSTAQSRFRRSTSSSMKSLTKFQNWALYCMTTHATCGCTQKNRSTYQISHFVFPIHACVGSWDRLHIKGQSRSLLLDRVCVVISFPVYSSIYRIIRRIWGFLCKFFITKV